MYSVTRRVSMVKQPRGGYLNKKQFDIICVDDGMVLNENENIHASLVGLAVDYLTRFMMGTPANVAFSISLSGAGNLDFANSVHIDVRGKSPDEVAAIYASGEIYKTLKPIEITKSRKLLAQIKGLDDNSIVSACKLVGYDVCFRANINGYKPIEEINPDKDTIKNINILVNRSVRFWSEYGPIVKDGFVFPSGYTGLVSTGDGDFMTKDTIWEFKTIKKDITSKHTLQLLMYYIMGCHSIYPEFKNIKRLGIFNPRHNKVYLADVSSIPQSVIDEVSTEVIGYK